MINIQNFYFSPNRTRLAVEYLTEEEESGIMELYLWEEPIAAFLRFITKAGKEIQNIHYNQDRTKVVIEYVVKNSDGKFEGQIEELDLNITEVKNLLDFLKNQ